jgi:hypothetical protein
MLLHQRISQVSLIQQFKTIMVSGLNTVTMSDNIQEFVNAQMIITLQKGIDDLKSGDTEQCKQTLDRLLENMTKLFEQK